MTTVTSSHKTKRFLVLALLLSLSVGPTFLGGKLLTSVHAKGKDKDQETELEAKESSLRP